MEIVPADPEHFPHIAQLFSAEYGRSTSVFMETVVPYIEETDSVALVAVDSSRVLGFQAYLDWPVTLNGVAIPARQSGLSIVAPEARGRGVFGSLLRWSSPSIERQLLFGFPVAASFPSFVSAGWTEPFSLSWHVRVMRRWPRSRRSSLIPGSASAEAPLGRLLLNSSTQTHRDSLWRDRGQPFLLATPSAEAEIRLRKHQLGLVEAIIGSLRTVDSGSAALARVLEDVTEHISRHTPAAFVSIASNPLSREWQSALSTAGFRAISRTIHFVTRNFDARDLPPWDKWWVFRGDIDTW